MDALNAIFNFLNVDIFRLQLTEINHLEVIEMPPIRFKINNIILKV